MQAYVLAPKKIATLRLVLGPSSGWDGKGIYFSIPIVSNLRLKDRVAHPVDTDLVIFLTEKGTLKKPFFTKLLSYLY